MMKTGKKIVARQVLNDTVHMHTEREASAARRITVSCGQDAEMSVAKGFLARPGKWASHYSSLYPCSRFFVNVLSRSLAAFSILRFWLVLNSIQLTLDLFAMMNTADTWCALICDSVSDDRGRKKIAFSSSSVFFSLFLLFTLCKQYRTVVFLRVWL